MGIKTVEKIVMASQRGLLSCLGVQFLSMEDVNDLAINLAGKIRKEYDPDLIVGVERGGVYPAYCLAEEMQIPYTTINISRKKMYVGNIETDQILLLSKLLGKSQKNPPRLESPFYYEGNARRALIIDDDCGSMRTLNLAKLHLARKNLKSKTSVILHESRGMPDFYAGKQTDLWKLAKRDKVFPWSQYSPYFKDYQLWLKK